MFTLDAIYCLILQANGDFCTTGDCRFVKYGSLLTRQGAFGALADDVIVTHSLLMSLTEGVQTLLIELGS